MMGQQGSGMAGWGSGQALLGDSEGGPQALLPRRSEPRSSQVAQAPLKRGMGTCCGLRLLGAPPSPNPRLGPRSLLHNAADAVAAHTLQV